MYDESAICPYSRMQLRLTTRYFERSIKKRKRRENISSLYLQTIRILQWKYLTSKNSSRIIIQ
jgi:hypothetical protein